MILKQLIGNNRPKENQSKVCIYLYLKEVQILCGYFMVIKLRQNKKNELAYITVVDFCWPRKSCRQNQKRTQTQHFPIVSSI